MTATRWQRLPTCHDTHRKDSCDCIALAKVTASRWQSIALAKACFSFLGGVKTPPTGLGSGMGSRRVTGIGCEERFEKPNEITGWPRSVFNSKTRPNTDACDNLPLRTKYVTFVPVHLSHTHRTHPPFLSMRRHRTHCFCRRVTIASAVLS